MAKGVKGVILGIKDVIVRSGVVDANLLREVGRLIAFIRSKGITPVVLSNHNWTIKSSQDEPKTDELQAILEENWGKFPWFVHKRDGTPPKPTAQATAYVLEKMGWAPNEVVYLGNSVDDMRTAVNGNILFLNATWYGKNTDYGFEFASPVEVARFIDLFCLREHLWHFAINDDDLEYYALAPYSTAIPEFAVYSHDAKQAAKFGAGHVDFWTKYLWATIYLSGLHLQVDYVAPYPGHGKGFGNSVVDVPISAFSKCFRIGYLQDLIVRHNTAPKLAFARAKGASIDSTSQLNSIVLNAAPTRGANGSRYRSPPLRSGKTLLVVDDICTRGYSLETARAFAKQTGVRVVLLSWLKTINTPYEAFSAVQPFNPYETQVFSKPPSTKSYGYNQHVIEPLAPEELAKRLQRFDNWTWPA